MRRFAIAVSLIAAAIAPGSATAYTDPPAKPSFVVEGRPWPGRGVTHITYFNGSEAKWAVKQAAQAWNSSGAKVRFSPAPRGRADLVIQDIKGPRSDGFLHGFATLGYVPPGGRSFYFDRNGRLRVSRKRHVMSLSLMRHPKRPNYNMAGVATHEFGHVLGLHHEDDLCATMNSSLWSGCKGARPCRLLERDDIKGAIRMYGGRAQTVKPAFCPKPPGKIRSIGDARDYGVTLEWKNPRGGLFTETAVRRGKGKCPTSLGRFGGFSLKGNRPGKVVRLKDHAFGGNSGLRTGRYCYSFWGTTGTAGLLSRRKTVWVKFDPVRPTAPTQLSAVVASDNSILLSWAAPDHPEFRRVEGAGAIGSCPARPDAGDEVFSGGGGQAKVTPTRPGRYCFAAWSVDSAGDIHGPATVFIDYKGLAPTAQFEYFTDDFLTAFFANYSYDDDSNIVGYQWNFGDGATSTEAEPSHTYTAGGTYTVRLTVTDDTGQTGTTTEQVTVSG